MIDRLELEDNDSDGNSEAEDEADTARQPRLVGNRSLAAQLQGVSGKDRQAVLDAHARQNPFELNPNSEDKDMIRKLAEQVAQLTKALGSVTQYSELVNAPQRASESPKAASIASLAQERLMVLSLMSLSFLGC